jgi:ubiquinone/menaquinone biosynthesis C-methylase UbiE
MNPIKRLLAFNSSRYRLWLENADFAASVPSGALVLDAGAGEAPYKCLFQHAIYESADFQKVNKQYAKSTYVCDLKKIPVEDRRFDFIVFNQVMEHVPEPSIVLAELHRILKENGKLIYTGPLFYEEHEQPYDFYSIPNLDCVICLLLLASKSSVLIGWKATLGHLATN